MFTKIRNSQIIVFCLLLGFLIGLIAYSFSKTSYAHSFSLQFSKNTLANYPDFFDKDTAIVVSNRIIRNYTSPLNNRENENSVFNLKITTTEPIDIHQIKNIIEKISQKEGVAKINLVSAVKRKRNNLILTYTLMGLFFGLILSKVGWPK